MIRFCLEATWSGGKRCLLLVFVLSHFYGVNQSASWICSLQGKRIIRLFSCLIHRERRRFPDSSLSPLHVAANSRNQLPRSQLQYIKELGTGYFGKVTQPVSCFDRNKVLPISGKGSTASTMRAVKLLTSSLLFCAFSLVFAT